MMGIEIPKNADNLNAIKSDGTTITAAAAGCTLANSTTYVFSLGDTKLEGVAPLSSVQLQWGTLLAATITIEVCNFASKIGRPDPVGASDVTDYDVATKGAWMLLNPSAAYVTVTSTDGSTGGGSIAAATVTVAGGTAGACYYDLGNLGARRLRVKVVVTTGDVVRCGANWKAVG